MAFLVVWFLLMLAAAPRLRNASLLLFTVALGALAAELLLRTDQMNRFVEERDLSEFRHGLVETLEPLFVSDPALAFRQLPDRRARATSIKTDTRSTTSSTRPTPTAFVRCQPVRPRQVIRRS